MDSSVVRWCNKIITSGFYFLFGLVPLLLTPWNYELFEFNKMMAVYIVTSFIVTSWIIKSIQQKEFRIAKTPLDIPIALFVISQLVSSIFSIDPHVSWFGYYSRFNGGMWSVISYTILYYIYVSHALNLKKLLTTALITASVVATYGVLEHFGIDKHLWVQDVQNRVFSTLGQPNWLAAYLVALIPLTFALGKYWNIASVLFFVTLLFTKSRSGLLAFGMADVVFLGLLYVTTHAELRKNSTKIILAVHLIFVALFVVFGNFIQLPTLSKSPEVVQTTTPTGPALETGGTESGTIRKYVWQGAINAWKSTTKTYLIGTGTETFAFAFYEHRPVGHNQTSEWDFLYNKAHNEYLNYLATTGLFGLGSYIVFIAAFILWFIKKHEKTAIDIALFSGWISLLVTNFFGFSVVATQLFFFLFPAMILTQSAHLAVRKTHIKVPTWSMWITGFFGLYVLVSLIATWIADMHFALGYRYNRAGLYGKAEPSLSQAIALRSNEPFFHDELGSTYAALALAAAEAENASQAGHLAKLAITENDSALTISPRNVNYWKTRTKIFYTLASINPDLNTEAISALETARLLSPNDPKIYYNIAILLGRIGKNAEAIEQLMRAKALKSNYRDAYFALYVFYTDMKETNKAKAILQEYTQTVDARDEDFIKRINELP